MMPHLPAADRIGTHTYTDQTKLKAPRRLLYAAAVSHQMPDGDSVCKLDTGGGMRHQLPL